MMRSIPWVTQQGTASQPASIRVPCIPRTRYVVSRYPEAREKLTTKSGIYRSHCWEQNGEGDETFPLHNSHLSLGSAHIFMYLPTFPATMPHRRYGLISLESRMVQSFASVVADGSGTGRGRKYIYLYLNGMRDLPMACEM